MGLKALPGDGNECPGFEADVHHWASERPESLIPDLPAIGLLYGVTAALQTGASALVPVAAWMQIVVHAGPHALIGGPNDWRCSASRYRELLG
jgi:hypothetical protein